jgi:hypothetical protein
MTVVNPFDFFVEPYADSFPFAYTNDLKTELAPYLATIEQGPLFAKYLKDIPREADSTVNFLVDLNAQLQKKDSLRHPHGAGHPDAGGDAGLGLRIVPRLRVAVDPNACGISGSPRASSPAISFSCAPTSIRSKDRARSKAISPICTPGPKSICRARAGSGSTSPRAC